MGPGNDDYNEWLENADVEDSELAREWYDCAEEDRSDFIEDHPDLWDKL